MNNAFCGSFLSEYPHSDNRYNNVKELLSRAYLTPICSYVGAVLEIKDRNMDNGGIDATVELPPNNDRLVPLRIDVQLKATSSPKIDANGDNLQFDMKVDTFRRMSSKKRCCPWLLFVLILPEDIHDWVVVNENELIERSFMVWCKVEDCCTSEGEKNVRLSIPLSNRITIESLHGLLLNQLEVGR